MGHCSTLTDAIFGVVANIMMNANVETPADVIERPMRRCSQPQLACVVGVRSSAPSLRTNHNTMGCTHVEHTTHVIMSCTPNATSCVVHISVIYAFPWGHEGVRRYIAPPPLTLVNFPGDPLIHSQGNGRWHPPHFSIRDWI
jgi:hypothetical protein